MLFYSRRKTAAVLGLALIVCLPALTNVLPASTFDMLPAWAQRKIELGIDLQGGSRYQLAVDTNYLREEQLGRLFDDVRHTLRGAQIVHGGVAMRNGAVEVRLRESSDLPRLLMSLQQFVELAVEPTGPRPAYSVSRKGELSLAAGWKAYHPPARVEIGVDGHLVRLTLTEDATSDRLKQGRMTSIDVVKRRLWDLGARFTVQPVSSDRLIVEVFDPEERWRRVQN